MIKIRYNKLLLFIGVLGLILSGCGQSDNLLEEALELAGENRTELERVLRFYESDSLKLQAAKFLIRNMPGHYSYADTVRVNHYYNAVDSMFDRFHGQSMDSIRIEINDLAKKWDIVNVPKVMDIKIISADFLIRNIDQAFCQWQTSPWCSHLSFDEFCEYILPYKSEELQPLDHWREEFSKLYIDELDKLYYADLFRNSSFRAATIVRDRMNVEYRPTLSESVRIPVFRTSTRLRIPFGMCEDYVARANTVFRSIGIPVAMEFIPQWSYGDNGHEWNIVLTRKGWEVPFSGLLSSPGEQHKPFENMPKVYRRIYSQNLELKEINRREKYVPPIFRNLFIKDVTSNHIAVVSLNVRIKRESDGVIYLTVAKGKKWEPIGWGYIVDGVAKFENVGRECIYLPVRYDADGKQRPLCAPIRVKSNGEIQQMAPRINCLTSVSLRRKYPVLEYVYVQALKLIGGEFQAASKLDFSDAVIVAKITAPSSQGQEVSVPDSIGAFRYWRYINHRAGTNASIAELSFIGDDGFCAHGKIIGSAPLFNSRENAVENAFDGRLLTNFNAESSDEGWVGMDFGKPKSLRSIRYYARGDGNAIESGDLYELFYWSTDGGWQSLGKKRGDTIALEYDNVPSNSLLLLHDHTKGHNEHVFVYENKEQRWW